jgi:hypothetical protein
MMGSRYGFVMRAVNDETENERTGRGYLYIDKGRALLCRGFWSRGTGHWALELAVGRMRGPQSSFVSEILMTA